MLHPNLGCSATEYASTAYHHQAHDQQGEAELQDMCTTPGLHLAQVWACDSSLGPTLTAQQAYLPTCHQRARSAALLQSQLATPWTQGVADSKQQISDAI